MLLILYVIALALAVSGAWALAWGIPMIVLERGWTWVISGSMYLTGAAIVFALAMVVRTLRQLPDMLEAGYADDPVRAPAGEAGKKPAAHVNAAPAPAKAVPAEAVPAEAILANRAPEGSGSVTPAASSAAPQAATPAANPAISPLPSGLAGAVGMSPKASPAQEPLTDGPSTAGGSSIAGNASKPVMPAPVAMQPPARQAGLADARRDELAGDKPKAPVAAPRSTQAAAQPGRIVPDRAAPAASVAPKPAMPSGAVSTPAPVKRAPMIPAAIEDRLNDLLRPGPRGPATEDASPSAGASAAPEQSVASAGNLAGALPNVLPKVLPRAPAPQPTGAKTSPDMAAPVSAGARPGVTAPGGKLEGQPDAAPDKDRSDAGNAPVVSARVGPAKDASALDASAGDALAGTASAGDAPKAALKEIAAKGDLASRIGSLFSRRAGKADSDSAAIASKTGAAGKDTGAGAGKRTPPVFPERPAARPAAQVGAAGAGFPPMPAVAPAVAPSASSASAATPGNGDVVFPTRPPPRKPAAVAAPELANAGEPVKAPQQSAAAGPAPDTAGPPVVVGSYTAAGTLYVMYSDGSIEAQTEFGVMHFPSLDALKEHVAKGDKGGG